VLAQVETAHALQHYYDCGQAPTPPTTMAVSRLLLITNGNGAELRQLARNSAVLSVLTAKPPQLLV
jgi:hypothetical protein